MTWSARPSLPAGHRLTAVDMDAICDEIARLNIATTSAIFQGRQTVAQSIPNSAFTALTFDVEDIDTLNGHSTSSNTSRYTCQVDGYYVLSGKVGWAASASAATRRASQWFRSGVSLDGSQAAWAPGGTTADTEFPAMTYIVALTAGQYIELHAFQETGGALNTSVSAGTQSVMNVHRIPG